MSESTTSSSSRKRKRDVSWELVVHSVQGLTVDREVLIRELAGVTPNATTFATLSRKNQEIICTACGVTGWQDAFLDVITKQVQG